MSLLYKNADHVDPTEQEKIMEKRLRIKATEMCDLRSLKCGVIVGVRCGDASISETALLHTTVCRSRVHSAWYYKQQATNQ